MSGIMLKDLVPLLTVSYPIIVLDSRRVIVHNGYANMIKDDLLPYPVEKITIDNNKRLTIIITV